MTSITKSIWFFFLLAVDSLVIYLPCIFYSVISCLLVFLLNRVFTRFTACDDDCNMPKLAFHIQYTLIKAEHQLYSKCLKDLYCAVETVWSRLQWA